VAAWAGVELPVHARRRCVFAFTCPTPIERCPLVIDTSGVWFRPEGRGYIAGAPPRGIDSDEAPLEAIDHGLFEEQIWPTLANRVAGFDALRVAGAWAGYYEYNTFDQNGIVGRIPGCLDAFIGCGFSGHGIQQAPAVGRALAELIALGRYETLDVSPLAPDRIAALRPLLERNVI